MTGLRVPQQDGDVAAFITIRLHQTGGVSVSGHIGDKRLALQLIDAARDAVKRQVPDARPIVIPGRDVEATPSIPLRDFGSMAPHERGDG